MPLLPFRDAFWKITSLVTNNTMFTPTKFSQPRVSWTSLFCEKTQGLKNSNIASVTKPSRGASSSRPPPAFWFQGLGSCCSNLLFRPSRGLLVPDLLLASCRLGPRVGLLFRLTMPLPSFLGWILGNNMPGLFTVTTLQVGFAPGRLARSLVVQRPVEVSWCPGIGTFLR